MSKNKAYCPLVFLLVICCLLSAGCWDREELSDLAIILAAGIDADPAGVELTVQVVRPAAFGGGAERQGGQAQENDIWVVSEKGRTVYEARRMLKKKVPRQIYWGHNIIMVVGEDIAREGLRNVTNFFSRFPRARETTWVFVTPGKAKELLKSHSQLEDTSAQAAGNMARSAIGVAVMLKDLKMMANVKGSNPVLPRLELTPSGAPQGIGEYENIPGGDEQQFITKIHAETTTTGTGVFDDDKLVGWLDIGETRGLVWLRDEVEKGTVIIPSLTEADKRTSIEIKKGSTEVEPFYDGQNIWFDVSIKAEGDLLEQQSFEDVTDPKIFDKMEQALAQAIEARARECLEKVQDEFGVDALDFGKAFHRKYKKDWAQMGGKWNEHFSTASVNISVDAEIRHTGLESKRAPKE